MRERGQNGNLLPALAGGFWGGDFSTGEVGKFQPALTIAQKRRPGSPCAAQDPEKNPAGRAGAKGRNPDVCPLRHRLYHVESCGTERPAGAGVVSLAMADRTDL